MDFCLDFFGFVGFFWILNLFFLSGPIQKFKKARWVANLARRR
jgi:hypothetical protein